MDRSPTELLADWLDSLPDSSGSLLGEHLRALLPPDIPIPRQTADHCLGALKAWLRAAPLGDKGPIEVVGVALAIAPLIDFSFNAISLHPNVPDPFPSEHTKQREKFLSMQDRRALDSWKTLRAGALSPTEIDQWLERRMRELMAAIMKNLPT